MVLNEGSIEPAEYDPPFERMIFNFILMILSIIVIIVTLNISNPSSVEKAFIIITLIIAQIVTYIVNLKFKICKVIFNKYIKEITI